MPAPLQNTLLTGLPRYGKTETVYATNVDRYESRDWPSFVISDPAGELTNKFGKAAVYHKKPLIYDYLRETSNVPGYDVLVKSDNPDPLQREAENRERVNEWISQLLQSRGLTDSSKNPIIHEGLNGAGNILLAQKEPVPFYILRDCFHHLSSAHNYLKANCTDFRWTFQFEAYAGLRGAQYEFKCGPAERVLREVCDSPQFRTRCVPTFDLAAFINSGGTLCLDGSSQGNLSRQDSQLIRSLVLLNVIRLARSGKLKRRVVLILDEGQSGGQLDVHIARATREAPKWGVEFQIIMHTPFVANPEVQDALHQNFSRKLWFRQADPKSTEFAARSIGMHLQDPHKLHSVETRTRLEHDGYDFLERMSVGKWKSGDQEGESETLNIVALAKFREKAEEFKRFYTPQEQQGELEKRLVSLGVGKCMIVSDELVTVEPVYMPLKRYVQDSMRSPKGPMSYGDYLLAKRIGELKTTADYQTPKPNEPWTIVKPKEYRARRGIK